MADSPAQIVRDLYRLWEEKGLEVAMEFVSPDIEWVEPRETIGGEARRGREDAAAGIADWQDSYEEWSGAVTDVEEDGPRVLVHFLQRARGRGGTVDVHSPVYHLWTLRDGVPARMEMFFDLAEARGLLRGE